MRVDESSIKHVAKVARLNLTEEEIKRFLPEMKEIIEAISTLESLDTEGVVPSFQPTEQKDRMREDAEVPCLTQEQALSNSTQKKDGYFKGPKAV